MSSQKSLKETIRQFVFECKKKFRYVDLRDYLQKQGIPFENDKTILDLLESEGIVFSTDFTLFYPRHLYFKNAQFLISPTEEELSNGYLIPGHRFLPFLNHSVKPWEVELKDASLQPFSTCRVRKRVRDLYVFYSLYSWGNPYNRYGEEKAKGDESRMVEVEAFDLSDRIKQWKLKPGGGFLVTVLDWVKGSYQIEPLSKRKRQSLLKAGTEWMRTLEQGFYQSFEDLDLKYPIEEQIAYAYFYAGKKVLTNPPIHLGGFIESSSLIHFVDVGLENRLWHTPHVANEELDLPNLPEPQGKSGTMGEILQDIGLSLEESSIEAYIRDAFFRGNASPEQVLSRIFAGRETNFSSQEQMDSFFKFFNDLWKRVKRSYNSFTDRHTGTVRNQILQILDQHTAWLRDLDRRKIDPKDLPKEEFLSLAQLFGFLERYLEILNRKNPGTEAELTESLSVIPLLEQTFQEIRNRVETALKKTTTIPISLDKVPNPQKERATPKQQETKGNEGTPLLKSRKSTKKKTVPYYVLKIQLQYIRPPIWRRIQVPGTYTLRDLHRVIQIAMGWRDYHLYEFLIDQKSYGPPAEEGFETIPDDSVRLQTLNLQLKQRFLYTYDFGDNWGHTIIVEKVLSEDEVHEEVRGKALCLTGKRACPPEDCGGYPGYEEILEALHAPNKKKYRELLDWVGSYDPELFDLEQINAKLKTLKE
ncbi:MAG: plasmid pRiA4b ORF-3 family protein [Spirochaetes bacterium]|nr:plasmid pRiA4b ORF-3 family protein [Spirochaetota bacterium]